jgi:hypothetical protein
MLLVVLRTEIRPLQQKVGAKVLLLVWMRLWRRLVLQNHMGRVRIRMQTGNILGHLKCLLVGILGRSIRKTVVTNRSLSWLLLIVGVSLQKPLLVCCRLKVGLILLRVVEREIIFMEYFNYKILRYLP